jgi:hypothetical protein
MMQTKSVGSANVSVLNTSFGTATANSVKASNAQLFGFYVTSINASLVYFQLFNKTTAPVNTDVPIYSIPLPAGSATVPSNINLGEAFFGPQGKNFSTGLAWGISSTLATFTDAGTASNYTVHLHYV